MPITIKNSTIDFLKKLSKNNNREWFNKNKNLYLAAHENVLAFVDALLSRCAGMILSKPALPKRVFLEYTGTCGFQRTNHPIKHIGQDILKGLQKNSEAAIIFRSDLEKQWQPEVSSTPIPKICFGSGRTLI